MSGYDGLERRSGQDRRDRQEPLLKGLFFSGVRESVRRAEDRKRIVFLDRYDPSMLIPIILVLILSLLDAALTLILIARGARELNPVMQYYINHGPKVFLLVKYGLTAASVLIIVLIYESLASRYRLRSTILPVFAAVFGCVVLWELYLLFGAR